VQPDHLDTPRVIVNAANQAVWQWDSAPFGEEDADENPSGLGAFAYRLRFPGQQHDAITRTHYNYFRDYAPAEGRYVESDPIGLLAGTNTYSYGASDPVSYNDKYSLIKIGDVMTYRDYRRKRRKGECENNFRGHHVPPTKTLELNGINPLDGVVVVIDDDEHRQTRSYGAKGRSVSCNMCDELETDLNDPPVRAQGNDVCTAIRCLNIELHPEQFK